MSATAVRSEYAALLSSTLPAVIRSEAENERCIRLLEELDRKGSHISAAERRMAELLTLLIEDFEEKHYALKAASPIEVLNEPQRYSLLPAPRAPGRLRRGLEKYSPIASN
jgi:HTH-type transcriptional regulator / antitoxin HigA